MRTLVQATPHAVAAYVLFYWSSVLLCYVCPTWVAPTCPVSCSTMRPRCRAASCSTVCWRRRAPCPVLSWVAPSCRVLFYHAHQRHRAVSCSTCVGAVVPCVLFHLRQCCRTVSCATVCRRPMFCSTVYQKPVSCQTPGRVSINVIFVFGSTKGN